MQKQFNIGITNLVVVGSRFLISVVFINNFTLQAWNLAHDACKSFKHILFRQPRILVAHRFARETIDDLNFV